VGKPILFIFDEIDRICGWEDYVLSLLDIPGNSVVITGSSSKILRGDTVSSAGQVRLRNVFSRYLQQGGYPGLLDLSADRPPWI